VLEQLHRRPMHLGDLILVEQMDEDRQADAQTAQQKYGLQEYHYSTSSRILSFEFLILSCTALPEPCANVDKCRRFLQNVFFRSPEKCNVLQWLGGGCETLHFSCKTLMLKELEE
jgi:hypothetical protein